MTWAKPAQVRLPLLLNPLAHEGDSPWRSPLGKMSYLLFLCFNLTRYERGLCQTGPRDDDVAGALRR